MSDNPIRSALESYRTQAALAPVLTPPFIQRMETFAGTLSLWGARINLTAKPRDAAETAFHIVDSLIPLTVIPEAFRRGVRVLDFGSGAGFPGLVLASACKARFTLVEARQKRASFLKVAAAEMGLDNVEIRPARLEPPAVEPGFDTALSRASGAPADFYAVAAAALAPGGCAVLYSTPSQRLDLAAAQKSGLGAYRRYRYSLRRGGAAVERVLAIWQRSEKTY